MNRLEKLIKTFVKEKIKYKSYDEEMARNLILGTEKTKGLSIPERENDIASLKENIESSVRGYTKNKDNAIAVYKDLIKYLNDNGVVIDMEFPPIPISSTFERCMFIAKNLQPEGDKIEDIRKKLWVSERTIENDLKKLRGYDDDPIQICGKKFIINETERYLGEFTFASTAHPLFLTPNLTQVMTTLQGLKTMSEKPEYHEYAIISAANIWEQLSNYAKDRLKYVFENLVKDDYSWYEQLPAQAEHFKTERECIGNNVYLDCLKNEKECFLDYDDGNERKIYENCRIMHLDTAENVVSIKADGNEEKLKIDGIKNSGYTRMDLVK